MEMNYGSQFDPRGGGVMATADVFERPAIRSAQVLMEQKAIPKQAYLDPWRENQVLYRIPVGPSAAGVPMRLAGAPDGAPVPKIAGGNRRGDIPTAVSWLRDDAMPQSAMADLARERRVQMGDAPAGGAHEYFGTLALNGRQGMAERSSSQYFGALTGGFSEEEKRQFLNSGERRRRFAHVKHACTDTLGLGKPLPLSNFKGGHVPTGPKYKSGAPNPFPKLAFDPREGGARQGPSGGADALGSDVGNGEGFNPWGAAAPWGDQSGDGSAREAAPESLPVQVPAEEGNNSEGPWTHDPWHTTRWGKTPAS